MVPNRHPTAAAAYRIALIGEAPGATEDKEGQPFVGASGRFLAALANRAGIHREACFLGNICQIRPPENKIARFAWNGPEIQDGQQRLTADLQAFAPSLCVLLGAVPLKAAKDNATVHPLVPQRFRYKIGAWRGSLFRCDQPGSPFHGYKCMAAYHPAYALRDYSAMPFLMFDLKRAASEGTSAALALPERTFDVALSADGIINRLRVIRACCMPITLDIEGGIDSMSCISFATTPGDAFVVPFFRKDFTACFSEADQCRIWRELALTLEDASVPKVLQNSLYDRFVLQHSYGIRVAGVVGDTMLKHWEYYCELEKSLAVQASIYTKEPYYKGDRKSQDDATFYAYCCRDSAVTYEIDSALDPLLSGKSVQHYRFNVELLDPLLYMELRGMRYDSAEAARRRAALRTQLFEQQALLNGASGRYFASTDEMLASAAALCFKRKPPTSLLALVDCAKKDARADLRRIQTLVAHPPTLAAIGEIETLLKRGLNVDAAKTFQNYLYSTLALPKRSNKSKDDSGDAKLTLTANYEALLKLAKHCTKVEDSAKLAVIRHAIQIRSLDTHQAMLSIRADSDGRIRCGYNVVGTETGRLTCYESPTGSGYNLQTIPKEDRDLYLADDGCYFFNCDLRGADGWTVAAYSAMLGDPTMLEDLRSGLKPAKILVLMLEGVQADFRDRSAIKDACKKVDGEGWQYGAMKSVQHGACYLEGGLTISNSIFKSSEGAFYVSPKECERLRDQCFFARYPGVRLWHRWLRRRLDDTSCLVTASGHRRRFFGRPGEILPEAAAHEPQANTTYATNLAAHRLYYDSENRLSADSPRLRVEPLHQVHDALCGQFRIEDTAWAVGKIKSWFANELTIANQRLVIPFDGGYGLSWGQACSESKRIGVI